MNIDFPKSLRKYLTGSKNDTYTIIIQRYFKDVFNSIIDILISEKNYDESNAVDFTDKLFSMSEKHMIIMKNIIERCHTEGKTIRECADQLLDKYYNETVVNRTPSDLNHEPINEGINSKKTSPKLFVVFLKKLLNIGIKFNFNTQHIKGSDNSLNDPNYLIYMATDFTNSVDVIYEFKYNKLFSDIIEHFSPTKSQISFYIGISKQSVIHYGFIVDDKRYEIGHTAYNNTLIYSLSSIIKTNMEIDFKSFANKFKSTINELYHAMEVIKHYTVNYKDIYVYMTIINNVFTIVIESEAGNVLSNSYINTILQNNSFKRSRYEFQVNSSRTDKKTKYEINIK